MGMCSYCHEWAPQWEECFSWDEAKACSGVEPPPEKQPRKKQKKRTRTQGTMKRAAVTLNSHPQR